MTMQFCGLGVLGGMGPSPLPMLQHGANVLARVGARAMVIACNTAYAWVGRLRIDAPTRLLHVVAAVLREFNADPPPNRKLGLPAIDTSRALARLAIDWWGASRARQSSAP